jgi:hypothetical protein
MIERYGDISTSEILQFSPPLIRIVERPVGVP